MRLQNLLRWALAFLLALSGYFIRGWYEDVNAKLKLVNEDRTSLIVLTNEVRHLSDTQAKMIEHLDNISEKLDEIRSAK